MLRRPPGYPRTDTLFPYRTPVRAPRSRRRPHVPRRRPRRPDPLRRPAMPKPIQEQAVLTESVNTKTGKILVDIVTPGIGSSGYRSEEHTSELQSLMRISYAVFCLKKPTKRNQNRQHKARQDT